MHNVGTFTKDKINCSHLRLIITIMQYACGTDVTFEVFPFSDHHFFLWFYFVKVWLGVLIYNIVSFTSIASCFSETNIPFEVTIRNFISHFRTPSYDLTWLLVYHQSTRKHRCCPSPSACHELQVVQLPSPVICQKAQFSTRGMKIRKDCA
jgi:hypothetical protein